MLTRRICIPELIASTKFLRASRQQTSRDRKSFNVIDIQQLDVDKGIQVARRSKNLLTIISCFSPIVIRLLPLYKYLNLLLLYSYSIVLNISYSRLRPYLILIIIIEDINLNIDINYKEPSTYVIVRRPTQPVLAYSRLVQIIPSLGIRGLSGILLYRPFRPTLYSLFSFQQFEQLYSRPIRVSHIILYLILIYELLYLYIIVYDT